jgi:hypothetical protein
MDPTAFDRLVTSLGATASRRTILGVLLPVLAALMRPAFETHARKDRGQGKRRGGSERGIPRRRKKARRKAPGRQRVRAEAASCCGDRACPVPGPGAQAAKCDFRGADLHGLNLQGAQLAKITGTGADFSGVEARGASFGAACLRGANFAGAQLEQTQFGGACLFFADLTDATVDVTRTLRAALLCGTTLPAGTVSDRDCAKSSPCCPLCDEANPCPTGKVCCATRCISVQDAVANAAPGDTITLCAGVFRATNVVIDKNLTLVGAGQGDNPRQDTILDGGEAGRVLEVAQGVTVTVRNLRIRNGLAPQSTDGGGISNAGDLTLNYVSVVGNSAGENGGGILNSGTLVLDGTTVADNAAAFNGGGIENTGNLTLRNNSELRHNGARSGGGIHTSIGALIIEDNSSVWFNSAGRNGGGIDILGGAVTVKTFSAVTNNEAGTAGGGISNLGALTLEANTVVAMNRAGREGGGILHFGPSVSVADTTIVVRNAAGGGLDNCRPVGAVPNCIG